MDNKNAFASVLFLVWLSSPAALADQHDNEYDEEDERIVVTGSRIPPAGDLNDTPIAIIDAQDFNRTPDGGRSIGAILVDGLSVWGAFFRIVLPISLPGMVAAFILSLVLCWNEYFFAALLTSTDAKTMPVMVASQTGSQGINWWSMAALSTAAILPLVLVGIFLERHIVKGMTAGAVK